jgi:hypothetical protein
MKATTTLQHCGSCGASIYRLLHERTGKRAPIEATPDDAGNIVVDLVAHTWRIVPQAERASWAGQLHLSHFARCPQAKAWRST